MRRTFPSVAIGLLALASAAQAQTTRRGRVTPAELASQIEQVSRQLDVAESNLKIVETQWTQRAAASTEETTKQQFSEAEIKYLLGDYEGAAVVFSDLVSDERFRRTERLGDALNYLADSLYQEKNYVGAQVYLRELLSMKQSAHYREALARYLEIAGHLNQFEGIDGYMAEARSVSGQLPEELQYVYGKWMFKRTDLPVDARLEKAQAIFEPLAANTSSAYRLQALYFLGVVELQRIKNGDFGPAIERFKQVLQAPATSEREKKVKELANLSLGRLYYEAGRYDEALDCYQNVPRESDSFIDSLYEIAWVHVRRAEWERAKNATDILLLAAPESTLAPEAQILQGHLLLKMKKYADATETYNSVITTYGPVRDEMDTLVHPDQSPDQFLEQLLKKHAQQQFDIEKLLPPIAVKWTNTQQDVAGAMKMVGDIEKGNRAIDESRDIANHVLKSLDERGMEAFPQLQEGYLRADAVESALAQAGQQVVRIEGYLAEDQLSADQQRRYNELKAQMGELEQKMASMPKTPEEIEARKKRMQERVDEVDKAAFRLGYEIQSQFAMLTAMEKWLDDTRNQRRNSPEDEKAFADQLHQEREVLIAHQKDLEQTRAQLAEQRNNADASIGGEAELRKQYEKLVEEQRAIVASSAAGVNADAQQMLGRAEKVRGTIATLEQRVAAAKDVLRAQLKQRGEQIRHKIETELALLSGYTADVSSVSGDAKHLVARIAFDGFDRVDRQFYDLVLKADVGIVDVAFTRKQDKTQEIQKVSAQKDRELHALDEEFKEVLKDVD